MVNFRSVFNIIGGASIAVVILFSVLLACNKIKIVSHSYLPGRDTISVVTTTHDTVWKRDTISVHISGPVAHDSIFIDNTDSSCYYLRTYIDSAEYDEYDVKTECVTKGTLESLDYQIKLKVPAVITNVQIQKDTIISEDIRSRFYAGGEIISKIGITDIAPGLMYSFKNYFAIKYSYGIFTKSQNFGVYFNIVNKNKNKKVVQLK